MLDGAEQLARGRAAGFSDEETLGVLSRRRLHQHPIRLSEADKQEAQRYWEEQLAKTAAEERNFGTEEPYGQRTLQNDDVQFEQDNRERDQSGTQMYSKDLDTRISEQAKARRTSKKGGRDTNRFFVTDPKTKKTSEVFIDDGQPTPEGLREQALASDFGLTAVKKGQVQKTGRNGAPVFNQDGTPVMRNDYDFENSYNETAAGQGNSSNMGRWSAEQLALLEMGQTVDSRFTDAALAERRRRVFGDDPVIPEGLERARLMDRLRRTSDPGYAKYVEAFQGRRAVQSSGEAFSSAMRAISDAVAAREAGGLVVSGQAGVDEIPYIPGALTSAKTPADAGIGIKTKRSESDARFARRPMAVPLNEESVEIARSLGDDVSGYVDMGTGESIPTAVTSSRVNTNISNTSQQLNSPVTTAASWVAANLREGKTGDLLADTNISQSTAEFSRRVEAAAPGYRTRPVRTLDDFSTAVQRVIDARRESGKNFYLRGDDGKNRKVEPGIESVMQLLRLTGGQQSELANALYTASLAGNGTRPVDSFSDGVTVSTGSMYGEKLDLATAGRDSTRAAFARLADEVVDEVTGERISNEAAQMPIIGAINERDESGAIVRGEPRPTRQVIKGRTPAEALQVYAAQRRKKGENPSRARARQIYRENASLRRDQEKTEIMNSLRELNRKSTTGPVSDRQTDDEDFFTAARARNQVVSDMQESAEIQELRRLIFGGAKFGSESKVLDYVDPNTGKKILKDAPEGRKLVVPDSMARKGPHKHYRITEPSPTAENNYGLPIESTTPGKAADISGITLETRKGEAAPRAGLVSTRKAGGVFSESGERITDQYNASLKSKAAAREPEPANRRLAITEHLKNNRRKYGYGAAGAGALAALTAALTGGRQQQEEEAIR